MTTTHSQEFAISVMERLRANTDILAQALENHNMVLAVYCHAKLYTICEELITPMIGHLCTNEDKLEMLNLAVNRETDVHQQWQDEMAKRITDFRP